MYDLVGNLDRELNPDGSTTDYTFDDLNRLTDITTTRSDGTLLTDFDYTLRDDGKRDDAVEKIYSDDGTLASHTTFDWEYDAAGRLTDEIFTNADGLLFDLDDYHTAFEYDLTGNRISKSTITDDDGTPGFDAATDTDEVITYGQGANDRMTSEDRVVDGVAVDSTSYGHTGTQQTSKAVTAAGSLHSVSSVVYSYDLQGRMSQAVTTATDPNTGVATRIDTTSYRYGTDGIRISATQKLDTDADGDIDSIERTEYLIDARNHTGYQQVLEETVYDVDPVTGVETESKKIVYTIGHDHVSQTTFEPGGPAEGETLVFHMDGHGSTRVLTDLAGSIAAAAAPQIFHFTAYGEAINFTMSEAATSYLYSGEQFDSRIGQQYLRARYYDAATGTFNRLDPFFGNQTDPQSFHKYTYTHGDPVNGIDPTGMFNVPSMIASIRIQANAFAVRVTTYAGVAAGVAGRFGNQLGARAQQFAGMVMNGVRGLQMMATDTRVVTTLRNTIDFVARLANNRVAMVEVKFALPRSGAAVTRLANQMRAMYERVQTEAAAGQAYHNVVWLLQRPNSSQLNTIRKSVGDTIYNNTQFVDGIDGLWIYLDYLSKVVH